MTSDVDDEKLLEKPFSTREKVKIILLVLVGYPIVLALMMLPGAWIRSFPQRPTLWYGFWVTEICIPVAVLLTLPFLFDQPRLLRKRMGKITASKEDSKPEQTFHKVTTVIYYIGMLVTGYDASASDNNSMGNNKNYYYPKLWNWIGVILMAVSGAFIVWVFRTNKYAARVVTVQQGQKLITIGPYSIVRHPLYMACIPCFCGYPLAIGSFWGVVPFAIIALILIPIRTIDEEDFLAQTFGKEYEEYRTKVPYRMIPLVF